MSNDTITAATIARELVDGLADYDNLTREAVEDLVAFSDLDVEIDAGDVWDAVEAIQSAERLHVEVWNGAPVVIDPKGGSWHPSDDAIEEVMHRTGYPRKLDHAALIELCVKKPMLGVWHA